MTATVHAPAFRPFRLRDMLRGERVYEFAEFYDVKNHVLRYDHRNGYLNYGYWVDGKQTINPSAALVEHVTRGMRLGSEDVLLDIGSGLGQPAVDVAERHGLRRVLGLNVQAKQVELANECAQNAGFADRVQHRVGDACRLADTLGDVEPTAIMSIEVLAEIPNVEQVFRQARAVLPTGGRFSFCDVVTCRAAGDAATVRALRRCLSWTTATLYGDSWRTDAWYRDALLDAGFDEVDVDLIGHKIYPLTYEHARDQLASLHGVPRSATFFTYANLLTLERLHKLGGVDYAVFHARVRGAA